MTNYLKTVWNKFWLLQYVVAVFVGCYAHRFDGDPFKRVLVQMLWGVPFFFACATSVRAMLLESRKLPNAGTAAWLYAGSLTLLLFISLGIVALAEFIDKMY